MKNKYQNKLNVLVLMMSDHIKKFSEERVKMTDEDVKLFVLTTLCIRILILRLS